MLVYRWLGFWAVEVPLSPKSHSQEVGEPVEVSLKVTVSGADPDVGLPVKLAVGAELGATTTTSWGGWAVSSLVAKIALSVPELLIPKPTAPFPVTAEGLRAIWAYAPSVGTGAAPSGEPAIAGALA